MPFFAATLIWGSTWIVIRDQLGVVPPSWSITYRFIIAGAAMLAWAAWKREPPRMDMRGIGFAAVLGLMQFCLNFNFVYRAEAFVTSGLVAVSFALLVVPNAVLSRIFLGQRMGGQLMVGSGVAIAGVALLFVHEARATEGGALGIGLGFTLLGIMSASVSNVMQASVTARAYPMATMLGVSMLLGAAINGAYAYVAAGPPTIELRTGYLLGLLYLGVVASAIVFTLYFGLIRVIGAAKSAYVGVVTPVIAMLFSTMFEGYRWSPLAAAGAVLTMAGLVVALSARRPNR